jgi:ribosomal protein S5
MNATRSALFRQGLLPHAKIWSSNHQAISRMAFIEASFSASPCRHFCPQRSMFAGQESWTIMSRENLNENLVENYLEGLEPCHEFVPKSLTDHQWVDFFNRDLDKVITKRLYEHYRNRYEQAVLPPPPENMPRDKNGNERLYFFDELCQWLFAMESPRRKAFIKWLIETKNRESLCRKIHFAFVRTKLAAANVKVEVPRELKRERVFMERFVRGIRGGRDFLNAMGKKRLSKAYKLSISPQEERIIREGLAQFEPMEDLPAYFDEFSNLLFEDKHRRSNKQFSFLNAKKSSPKLTSTYPSTMNELSLEMTGETIAQFDHAMNVSVSTDSEQFLNKTFRAEKGMYGSFPFREDEFHKYNMLLDQVEDGTMISERTEGLPSGGTIGAADDFGLELEYPDESYERHGAKLTFPEGYDGDKMDPYEINLKNPFPQHIIRPHVLHSIRKNLPGTFLDMSTRYQEFILKRSRTTVSKTRGRIESFNAYILVCSYTGFIGAGFGEAKNRRVALRTARKNAIMNLKAIPRSAFPLIRNEIRAKFMKSEVVMYPSTHRNPTANNLLKRVLSILGIESVAVKCYGNNNIINVIPAFLKCLDKLRTLEKDALQRGMLPKHIYNRTEDILERVRHNRGIYGWH